MDKRKSKFANALLTVAALSTMAASAQAVVFTEPATDVGQTLATAAAAGTFNGTSAGLTGISGTISSTSGGSDVDLYSFTLSSATALQFVSNSTNALLDTSIFLFNSTGAAVIANDDSSGTNFYGAFTTGLLSAGTYYFGIGTTGNEPVNSNNQLLFTSNQPSTNVRGPASGLNPTALSAFNGQNTFNDTGAYSVSITAAVPEPSTNVALAVGALASFAFVRRFRRQQAA